MNSLLAFRQLAATPVGSGEATRTWRRTGRMDANSLGISVYVLDETYACEPPEIQQRLRLADESARITLRVIRPGAKSHHSLTDESGSASFSNLPADAAVLCIVKCSKRGEYKRTQTRVVKIASGTNDVEFTFVRPASARTSRVVLAK